MYYDDLILLNKNKYKNIYEGCTKNLIYGA